MPLPFPHEPRTRACSSSVASRPFIIAKTNKGFKFVCFAVYTERGRSATVPFPYSHYELDSEEPKFVVSCRGGDDGIRTHDPYVANVMLSQLSYIPTYGARFAQAHIVLVVLSFVK